MKEYKVGMLGFGSMGRTHTWCLSNLPFFYGNLPFRVVPYGVCTTTMEKSKTVAEQFGFSLPTNQEDDLISNPDIDVLHICTPNNCHYETLKKAIASGKHVLCEKPLCITKAQADEIASMPRKSGQILGMEFNNRWMAPVLRAKQLIDEGRIGRVLTYDGEYLHSSATDVHKPAGWKQDKTICGGGVLFDLGSHVIDMLHYLGCTFATVSGISQIGYPERTGRDGTPWKTNAEESFYLQGIAKDGAVGRVFVGKLQAGATDDMGFRIYGEKGALQYSLTHPNELYFFDNTVPSEPQGGMQGFTAIQCFGRYPDRIFPSQKAPTGWLSGHLQSIYSFYNAIYTGTPFRPDLTDGAYVQNVMETALKSAQERSMLLSVEA